MTTTNLMQYFIFLISSLRIVELKLVVQFYFGNILLLSCSTFFCLREFNFRVIYWKPIISYETSEELVKVYKLDQLRKHTKLWKKTNHQLAQFFKLCTRRFCVSSIHEKINKTHLRTNNSKLSVAHTMVLTYTIQLSKNVFVTKIENKKVNFAML